MTICSAKVENALNGVGYTLDCTERLLRMTQGFLLVATTSIHPTNSLVRSMHLHKLLSGAAFGRDFINALYTVRDAWALP
ncbi:MAG: hypothetical protein JSR80_01910, partial [Verrucomicrobia bacterium]|nr:hypothetical protein [Verrucomicrobiota bacterium]